LKNNIHIFFFFLISLATAGQVDTLKQQIAVQSGYIDIKPELPDAIVYTKDADGQVYIVHEGIEMWCDQAYLYSKDNFVKAYGDVKVTQGDSIKMNSRYAEYNGNTKFAFTSGDVVMENPQTTLKTDTLYFDRVKQQAFYRSGGTVIDTASTLTSRVGRYFTESKKYQFLSNVKIDNPEYTLNSEQLDFYSDTGGAYLYGKSTIISETSTVYCERGYYDTRGDTGYFVKNSRVDYKNRILYGDSIYFDRNRAFASATNNIKVVDTANQSTIKGHYAEVYRKQDSVFITKRAIAATLRDKDSIYVHADTLRITGKTENRILRGYYRARLFKKGTPEEGNTSGKCDSIFIYEKSGITKLLTNPVLWMGENQITGDTIHILNNIKTEKLDTLKVFKNAFLIQKDSLGYNQVKGERLIGLFTNNELDTVNIDKNVEVIFYLYGDDKVLTGIDMTTASQLELTLENQEIVATRFFKKVPGKIYPPSRLPESDRILSKFNWRGEERLMRKEDLFSEKPAPFLPTIKGIPLPEDEGGFFEEQDANDDPLEIPENSKLSPKDFINRPEDQAPLRAIDTDNSNDEYDGGNLNRVQN
jgi:lipopolysaccharide export system protein LptA